MRPHISIIVPIYNVAPYIRQCLASIVDQTYTGTIECICIDDCGDDNSMDLLKSFLECYKGNVEFRVIHHDINRGLSASRNTGINSAKGDYLYFLDSDDWIEKDCLDNMMKIIESYTGCQLVQAFAKKGDKDFLCDEVVKRMPVYSENPKVIKNLLLNSGISIIEAWNKLVRRDFVIRNNLYFREGVVNEDVLWRFYLAKYVNKLGICHKNTYNYRIREDSIMTRPIGTRFDSLLKVFKEMIDNVDDFCRTEQVYSIGKQLYDLYYTLSEYEMKNEIGLLMKRLSQETGGWLKWKLLFFSIFHNSQIRNTKIGNFCFYKLTVLR